VIKTGEPDVLDEIGGESFNQLLQLIIERNLKAHTNPALGELIGKNSPPDDS
jgi:hypothetical protein